jgi:hypothetical protein
MEGPTGEDGKNTRRIPREYEGNTSAPPKPLASNRLATRFLRALNWLCPGFRWPRLLRTSFSVQPSVVRVPYRTDWEVGTANRAESHQRQFYGSYEPGGPSAKIIPDQLVIYLDHNATTPVLPEVFEGMDREDCVKPYA